MNSQKQYETHILSPRHINTKNSIDKVGGVGMANMALAQSRSISEAIGPKRPRFSSDFRQTQVDPYTVYPPQFAIAAAALENLNYGADPRMVLGDPQQESNNPF